MKEGTITKIILLICLAFTVTVYGQNPIYSTLAKNVNPEAKSLRHQLNTAGDTLILESDYMLYKVEFIGNYDLKVFEIEGSKNQTKIDLSTVPVGEYTIAAFQIERNDDIYQYQKTIIFRISRLLPINRPENMLQNTIAENNEVFEEGTQTSGTINESEDLAFEEVNGVALEEAKPAAINQKRIPKLRRPKRKTSLAATTRTTNQKKTKPKPEYKSVTKEKPVVERKRPASNENPYVSQEVEADNTVYKSYNLTDARDGRFVVQSRADYRANNLRPNGEPYN